MLKFSLIKRAECRWCKRFISCAITNGIPACGQCDPERFAAAAQTQKEAWLSGDLV